MMARTVILVHSWGIGGQRLNDEKHHHIWRNMKKKAQKQSGYLQPRKFHSSPHNSNNVSLASFAQAIPRSPL